MKHYLFLAILLMNSSLLQASEPTAETGQENSGWDEVGQSIKSTSGKTWGATKSTSKKVWKATKKGSGKAWEATKDGSGKAWKATKEFSNETWNKTKEAVSD